MGNVDRVGVVNPRSHRADVAIPVVPEEGAPWEPSDRAKGRDTRRSEFITDSDDRAPDEAGYGYGV